MGDAARIAGAGLEAGVPAIAAKASLSLGTFSWKSQSVMSSCSTGREPRSPWISVRLSRPG